MKAALSPSYTEHGFMWQKLGKSYPLRLEIIPLGLLILTWYLAVSAYPELPARIPTHFDILGVPDSWGDRSEIFILPGIITGIYLLITVIIVWLALTKDPRGLINLPAERKARLTVAQAEVLRVFLNRCLFGLKVLVEAMMAYMVYMTVEVAQGRASTLGTLWLFFLIGILALVGVMVWRSFRLTAPPRRIDSP